MKPQTPEPNQTPEPMHVAVTPAAPVAPTHSISSKPLKSCFVCKRNLAYVRAPITIDDHLFCGTGCISIADGSIRRSIRQSRNRARLFLLLRYYILLALGVGAVISSVIIYGDFFSGSFYFRRPVSFLIMPVFGVLISLYSIREIRRMSRRRRI
ncbi:MAG: hypothetical protein WC661_21645 [Opitutaceae bacterium]|jgi:hypothetical protein